MEHNPDGPPTGCRVSKGVGFMYCLEGTPRGVYCRPWWGWMGGEWVFGIVWGLAVLRELERVSGCTVDRHAAIPPSTHG